jgi:hypothetical protein
MLYHSKNRITYCLSKYITYHDKQNILNAFLDMTCCKPSNITEVKILVDFKAR